MKFLLSMVLLLPNLAFADTICDSMPTKYALKNLNDINDLKGYMLYLTLTSYQRQVINGTSVEVKDLRTLCYKIEAAKKAHKDPNLVYLKLNLN